MARKKKQTAPDDDLRMVPIEKIRVDGGTQTRVGGVNEDTAEDFAATYREKPGVMPPLDCVFDGEDYWLTDGFHRLCGASDAGLTEVPVRVFVGTLDDALYRAGAANKDHHAGRRTNADKRRAVETVFRSQQSRLKSDSAIASDCGVGRSLVADVRRQLADSASCPQSPRRVGLDGRTRDTSKIGKSQPLAPWDLTGEPDPPPDEAPDYEPPTLSDEEQQAIGELLIRDAHEGGGRPVPSRNGTPPATKKPKPPKPVQVEVTDAAGNRVPARLRDVFADTKLAEQLARLRRWRESVEHASVVKHVNAVLAHYGPWLKEPFVREMLEEAHADLLAAERHLERALPYALCPHCLETAGGCESCRGMGWAPRWRYEELESHARMEADGAS